MEKQHHRILKKLLLGLLGLGVVVGGYSGWQVYQDFRILKTIQNQQDQVSRYRQQAEQKPQEPKPWVQLGDAAFEFWQNAGQGIRIAKEVNQMSLVWEWFGAKNSALKEANLAYRRALKLAPQSVEAVAGLCQVLIEQSEPAKAVIICQKAVQSRPAQPELY